MKAKSKILLALSVLTAGTLAAGATSTFAWFTTTRSVDLTYSKISVVNKQGNLQAKIYAWDTDAFKNGSNKQIATMTMSELSSKDGVTFAKPKWETAAGGNIAGMNTPIIGVDYSVALIEVTNTGDTNLDVYLDLGTGIFANNDTLPADLAAANLSRVAINKVDGPVGSATQACSAAKETKIIENNLKYDKPSEYSTEVYTAQKYMSTTPGYAVADVPTAGYFGTTKAADAFKEQKVGSLEESQRIVQGLAKDAYVYFHVAVWLEGTKSTGKYFNSATGGNVDVKFTLSAFDAA
ncbi:MAG: hypothetical protein SPG64_03165 [Candidatus Enteromonas sp.]|nr:hypothetical protein [Candidatus Enteromonas sp.]